MGWFCTPPGRIHDPLAHIHTHDPVIVSQPYTNLQFFPIFLHFRVRPVHQFTIFGRFSALSCTPRSVPPRTLCGRCHFRGYTHRNPNCQSPDYHYITRNDRGRCPPYLDTYRSRVGGRRGKKAAEGEVTREVRSGEIGFFGPVRKNHFTAQQGRRRSAVGEKAAGRWGTKEGRRRKKAKKREEKQRSGKKSKEAGKIKKKVSA